MYYPSFTSSFTSLNARDFEDTKKQRFLRLLDDDDDDDDDDEQEEIGVDTGEKSGDGRPKTGRRRDPIAVFFVPCADDGGETKTRARKGDGSAERIED